MQVFFKDGRHTEKQKNFFRPKQSSDRVNKSLLATTSSS